MKRLIISVAILSIFFVISAKAEVLTKNNIGGPSYLLVLSAMSGTMDGDTLTLKGVPTVVYFSDRPARFAGHKSMEEFEGLWNNSSDSFKADPPNATLSILKEDGATNVVVELISMKHEGDLCTFKVRVLQGNASKTFGPAALFIDSKIIGIDLGPGN